MIKFLVKILAFYIITFGIVGVLILVDGSLFDLQGSGDFFLRSTPWQFVSAFFVTPVSILISFLLSIPGGHVFAPDVLEIHLVITTFFALAIFGLLKRSRFIIIVAALMPVSWAILDLDLIRFIQVKYTP